MSDHARTENNVASVDGVTLCQQDQLPAVASKKKATTVTVKRFLRTRMLFTQSLTKSVDVSE